MLDGLKARVWIITKYQIHYNKRTLKCDMILTLLQSGPKASATARFRVGEGQP